MTSKALPTPVEVSPEPATAANAVQKIEAALESKVETTGQTTPEINSVPKTEVKAESPPGFSQSLSPYPLVLLFFIALLALQLFCSNLCSWNMKLMKYSLVVTIISCEIQEA